MQLKSQLDWRKRLKTKQEDHTPQQAKQQRVVFKTTLSPAVPGQPQGGQLWGGRNIVRCFGGHAADPSEAISTPTHT